MPNKKGRHVRKRELELAVTMSRKGSVSTGGVQCTVKLLDVTDIVLDIAVSGCVLISKCTN